MHTLMRAHYPLFAGGSVNYSTFWILLEFFISPKVKNQFDFQADEHPPYLSLTMAE